MRGKQRRHRTLYISFLISRLWRSLFGRSRLGPWRDRSRRASEGARGRRGARRRTGRTPARQSEVRCDDRRDALDQTTPPLRSYESALPQKHVEALHTRFIWCLGYGTRLSVSSEKRRERAVRPAVRRAGRPPSAQRHDRHPVPISRHLRGSEQARRVHTPRASLPRESVLEAAARPPPSAAEPETSQRLGPPQRTLVRAPCDRSSRGRRVVGTYGLHTKR